MHLSPQRQVKICLMMNYVIAPSLIAAKNPNSLLTSNFISFFLFLSQVGLKSLLATFRSMSLSDYNTFDWNDL
jgi:hypothetical protein